MSLWNALSAVERVWFFGLLMTRLRVSSREPYFINIYHLTRDTGDGNSGADAQCQPSGSLIG